jgi:hypothetical protein
MAVYVFDTSALLTALTADRAWLGLDLGIKIECVRPE